VITPNKSPFNWADKLIVAIIIAMLMLAIYDKFTGGTVYGG
jgi:hypothetical protein